MNTSYRTETLCIVDTITDFHIGGDSPEGREVDFKNIETIRKALSAAGSSIRGAIFEENGNQHGISRALAQVRKTPFWSQFYVKRSIYQDRLGTSIGKVEKEGVFCRLGTPTVPCAWEISSASMCPPLLCSCFHATTTAGIRGMSSLRQHRRGWRRQGWYRYWCRGHPAIVLCAAALSAAAAAAAAAAPRLT
jgi:hypothetical protein